MNTKRRWTIFNHTSRLQAIACRHCSYVTGFGQQQDTPG